MTSSSSIKSFPPLVKMSDFFSVSLSLLLCAVWLIQSLLQHMVQYPSWYLNSPKNIESDVNTWNYICFIIFYKYFWSFQESHCLLCWVILSSAVSRHEIKLSGSLSASLYGGSGYSRGTVQVGGGTPLWCVHHVKAPNQWSDPLMVPPSIWRFGSLFISNVFEVLFQCFASFPQF